MATTADIASEVRALVGPNPGQTARAWALAWRAVRFLEQTAETARRHRLTVLDPGMLTYPIGDPVKFVAARCASIAIKAPVLGEAAVVAAIENSSDLARSVAESLYRDRVAEHEKADEAKVADPRRLARLRRLRSVTIVRAENFLHMTGCDE